MRLSSVCESRSLARSLGLANSLYNHRYGFAILGLFAAAVSVAQSCVGTSAHHVSTSNDLSRSTKLGDMTHSHVRVHVQTRTEVESEKERNVVQLELQDWQGVHEEKVRFAEDM